VAAPISPASARESARPNQSRTDTVAYALAVAVICAELLFIFIVKSGVNAHQGNAALEDLMVLNSDYVRRPAAKRVLVPQLVRAASLPLAPIKPHIDEAAWNVPVLSSLLERFEARRTYYTLDDVLTTFDHTTEALVCWTILWFFFMGFVFSMRRLVRATRTGDDMRILPIAAAPALVPFMSAGYVWDPATLFFWALLLWLMAEQRWRTYCVVFPLACLNRETTVLLAVVFACGFFGRMERRRFFGLLAFQIAAAAVMYGAVELALSARGVVGPAAEWNLAKHVPSGRLIGIDRFVLGASLAAMTLALVRSRRNPLLLGQAVLIPLLLTAYALFCAPGELRDFYELVPLGLLSLVPVRREIESPRRVVPRRLSAAAV
jgi:hypothetical protein